MAVTQQERQFISIGAAARLLNVSHHWVWRRVRRGDFVAYRLDQRSPYQVLRSSIAPLIAKVRAAAQNPEST